MVAVVFIVRALVSDPLTPARALAGLARDCGWQLAATLAAHPNVPDGLAAQLLGADSGGPARPGVYSGVLHTALAGEPATATTRARVLRATPTVDLVTYLEVWPQPHPNVLLELATRPFGHDATLNVRHATVIALAPASPDEARLRALRHLVTVPTFGGFDAVANGHLAPTAVLGSVRVQALHHPSHLPNLAAAALGPTRDHLLAYADVDDPLALFRDTRLVATAAELHGAPFAWDDLIANTGDTVIADRVLDLEPDLGPVAALRLARAVQSHPALAGTPVWWRAQVRLETGTLLPAGAVTSAKQAKLTIAELKPAAGSKAITSVAPHDPDATELLAASWQHLSTGPDRLESAEPEQLARYALHPALPSSERRRAAHAFAYTLPMSTYGARSVLSDHVGALADLASSASCGPLHDALVDTPLPALRALAGYDHVVDQLTTWHLSRALRAHHRALTADVTRTIAALEQNFTGSSAELIATATTVGS